MKKIIITGPEASGKSELANSLASHFQAPFVPEYARLFLSRLERPYVEQDLLAIAKGQDEWHSKQAAGAEHLLICDTSMLVLKVWSDYRFGKTDPWILDRLYDDKEPLYLLCKPDIPWVPDPLRENPDDRDQLFDIYHLELTGLGNPFVIITGLEHHKRLKLAIEAIQRFLV